jgi:WD40 repeat protein
VATATFGRVRVSVLASGEAVGSLTVPNVRTVAFSPDGRRLVTGGAREEVFLWDCESGERLTSLRAEAAFSEGLILRLAFLPDPRGLVTGATGGKLRLWKLPD